MPFDPNLDTDRLTLRPLALRDFAAFCRLQGSAQVRKYLGGAVPRRQWLRRFLTYRQGAAMVGIWAVWVRSSGRTIGLVELTPHKDGVDYEVSYQFLPLFWGQGFASEAVGRVLLYGLNDVNLPRIIAETQSANAASCRLLQNLGMHEFARLQRFGAEQVIFAT